MKKPLTNFVQTYLCSNDTFISQSVCATDASFQLQLGSLKKVRIRIFTISQFCQKSSTMAVKHPRRCQLNLPCNDKDFSDYPWNRKIQSTVKNVFLEMVVSNFILFKMKNDCNMHTILGTTRSLYRFSMNALFEFWIAAEQRCKTTFLSKKEVFFFFIFGIER